MYRVMLVDDSLFLRKWYRMIFERNGIDIAGEASNGFEAIARYPELQPDVVLLDINMPGISGLDTLKELIKIDAHAKIIMSTAMGQQAFVQKSILAGAKSFLVKPVTESVLVDTVKKVARR
ncbi:response regulator [Christensenellaceae bacterium OttesenSCG-928-M15]|nr:response regulator [Christensenellaceae bacterium OttesenSCG-928-M15]